MCGKITYKVSESNVLYPDATNNVLFSSYTGLVSQKMRFAASRLLGKNYGSSFSFSVAEKSQCSPPSA